MHLITIAQYLDIQCNHPYYNLFKLLHIFTDLVLSFKKKVLTVNLCNNELIFAICIYGL